MIILNRGTWVKINVNNLKANVKNIVKTYDYKYYIGVVKGNAYGHGMVIINDLINSGINYLAVLSLDEALEVRKYHKKIPILCLQPIKIECLKLCEKNNIALCLHTLDYYEQLKNLKINLKIHLKINSGMNRLGLNNQQEIDYLYTDINNYPNLELEGIFTHFRTPGLFDKSWDNQLKRFKELITNINLNNIKIVHIDRSNTMLAHNKCDFCNGVRLGIIMYGYWTMVKYSNNLKDQMIKVKRNLENKIKGVSKTNKDQGLNLKPALALHSTVIQVNKIKKGEYVGYGIGCKAYKDQVIAVIECGYGDGFNRKNKGRYVLINNKKYPIIADITMGMLFVLVDNNVKVNDDVVLIGENISLPYVAKYLNTSIYEVLCMIDSSIPRIYER